MGDFRESQFDISNFKQLLNDIPEEIAPYSFLNGPGKSLSRKIVSAIPCKFNNAFKEI